MIKLNSMSPAKRKTIRKIMKATGGNARQFRGNAIRWLSVHVLNSGRYVPPKRD